MARRRTHEAAPRTKTVTIRLTPDEYLRRCVDARKARLSLSGLCERLVCDGKVEAAPTYQRLDPEMLAELRRIGNNVNQIAHALNSNLPPDVQFAYRQARDLLRLLGEQQQQHGFVHRIAQALAPRNPSNDPQTAQARREFQRSVHIHPARSRPEHG